MMTQEQVIAKIQKLLKLAGNNPSKAESESAMLKAQALMAQYNVEVEAETQEKIEYSLEMCVHANNNGYRIPLSSIIADNFRCKPIIRGGIICFFGRKMDAKAAKEIFEFAYKVIRKGIIAEERKERAEYGTSRGVSASYSRGFLSGLKSKLDEQCRALMIVTPVDVIEGFHAKFPSLGVHKGGIQDGNFHMGAYLKGQKDGKSLLDKRSITE